MTPINTKTAQRRQIELHSFDQLRAELDRLERAHAAGTLTWTGNWTPGQVLEHCAKLFIGALEGFPAQMKPPWFVKTLAKLIFKPRAVKGSPPPAGIKLPAQASFFLPGESTGFEEGLGLLRAQLDRVAGGERMTHPSPLFDDLTHEQWTNIQLGHCTLHLSFLDPGPTA